MIVRKPIDYGAMFAALDALMAAELQQMELYYEIGRLVSARPEKGAAVAAAEYLCAAYPNASGFSPRNLRRMREFYRTYESVPEMLAQAMTMRQFAACFGANQAISWSTWKTKKQWRHKSPSYKTKKGNVSKLDTFPFFMRRCLNSS